MSTIASRMPMGITPPARPYLVETTSPRPSTASAVPSTSGVSTSAPTAGPMSATTPAATAAALMVSRPSGLRSFGRDGPGAVGTGGTGGGGGGGEYAVPAVRPYGSAAGGAAIGPTVPIGPIGPGGGKPVAGAGPATGDGGRSPRRATKTPSA